MALAAASIVIIIMVVAILCVKSKTYKYKGEHLYIMQTLEHNNQNPMLNQYNFCECLAPKSLLLIGVSRLCEFLAYMNLWLK